MATNHKLALIVNKIPLEPVDCSRFGTIGGTRRFLTPVRFRQISLRPKKLPKITPDDKRKSHAYGLGDVLNTFNSSKGVLQLESLLRTRIKLNVVQNKHYGYIKNSTRKKMQDTIKSKSRQESPIQASFQLQEAKVLNFQSNPRMVDATFNTDFDLINYEFSYPALINPQFPTH
jgi:hypothetical protein